MRQPVTRVIVVALLAIAVTFGAVTAIPTRTSAGSLSTAIIGMFPKDAGEFAYADLKDRPKISVVRAAQRPAAAPALPPIRAIPRLVRR